MISPLRLALIFLYCSASGSSPLLAQKTGWEHLLDNDFAQARPAFEAALRQTPRDEASLTGLLFLAETRRDHETYERCANQLLDAGWKPEYVWLFQRMFAGSPEEALRRPIDSRHRLCEWSLQQADTLFKSRQFEASLALRQATVPDWNWSLCGPFTNIAGSGFAEPSAVETQPFNLRDSFENEDGLRFSWLPYAQRKPGAPVEFSRLAPPNGLASWYANTFFSLPDARKVWLRITRGEPMKIWLDDQLLFDRNQPGPAEEWDSESLLLELPAGPHRLLVKLSAFPAEQSESHHQLEFNDLANNGDQDYEPDYEGIAENRPFDWQTTARFALRFTDPLSGQAYTDLASSYDGRYLPARQPWPAVAEEYPYLQSLLDAWRQRPADQWRLYPIAKAFAKYGRWEEGEAFFAGLLAREPGSAYLRFLLAKFFDVNGKSERAEALLSELDTARTPTYAEHYIRLLKINKEQEEPQYLAALEDMLQLSPTNWYLLSRYLMYLKDKGREDQLKSYVRSFLDQHGQPKWKRRLEEYLKSESYKPQSFKPETDEDREKAFRQAKKRLKSAFRLNDMAQLIRYYKQKDNTGAVLATYDEVLAIAPWLHYYRQQKAAYLFEKERLEEALAQVRQLLVWMPYDPSLCELAGDILIEKKDEAGALGWYRRAEILKGRNAYDLAGKIERLENRRNYSGYFAPVDLSEVARDQSWLPEYAGEEAVISLFAQQIVFLENKRQFQASAKCAIHILNEAGAKRWTEADLSLLGNITSARVVKKDGAVTSPDLGWGGTAVFKNLQPGDVILLESSSERGMPEEFSGAMLDLNFLSWPAPVLKATYELLLPAALPVYFAYNRLDSIHTQRDTAGFRLRRWDWQHLPKLEDEEAMPENIDATAWIMYGSAPDWSQVVQWYQRKTYCRTEPNYEVLAQARALLRPGLSEDQIVETLHTFITKDINYSYVPFLNSNYVPKKPGATLSAKVGDCKDVATLMIAMLREQGIPAWYTLVSTHTFSNEEPRPTPYVFNHAIVAYQTRDGHLHFDDLTTDYFPNGVLPFSDSEAWGLVVRDGETRLRRLPNHALDPAISRVDIDAEAQLDTLGNLHIEARVLHHGVAAGNWRETLLRAAPEERLKRLTEYYSGGVLSHLSIESSHFDNLDSINAPLRSTTRLLAFHQMDQVAGLYILPLPLPLSTPTQKTLFAAQRYNDLDADALLELTPVRETVTLHIPKGYRLAEVPKSLRLQSPFGEYALRFEALPNGLRIEREVTLTRRFVHHTDFQAFKQFYLDMLEADDSLLALRRG